MENQIILVGRFVLDLEINEIESRKEEKND